MTDDHGLPIQAVDDRLLVVCDLADSLAGEHLRVLSGRGDCLGIVGPARCHTHIAGLLEERYPAVPARGQQPEPVDEHDGCRARGVRALDLRYLVRSDGRLGDRDGHLLLLVSRDSSTSVMRSYWPGRRSVS